MPLKPHISPKETASQPGAGANERERKKERERHFIQNASKIARSYDSQVSSDRIRSSQDSLGVLFTSAVGHCEK